MAYSRLDRLSANAGNRLEPNLDSAKAEIVDRLDWRPIDVGVRVQAREEADRITFLIDSEAWVVVSEVVVEVTW
jgi:hypothetical protein